MATRSFSDQLGHRVLLTDVPKRIVSLVPSQTELLFDLGLESEVAGITKFCIRPSHWRASKKIIGGTKNFHFQTIDELAPDLILGNKEENYQEGIEHLRQKYAVWVSDIISLQQALDMISAVGSITGRSAKAIEIVESIQRSFARLKKKEPKRVLYLIWRGPWMAAGSKTFIHTMLEGIGWINCLAGHTRYPQLTDDDIRDLHPELILLSSEPYPFKDKHKMELQTIAPSAEIALVDGEMFSWYGSRLIQSPEYFNKLDL